MSPLLGNLKLGFVSFWISIANFKEYVCGYESPFFTLNSTMTWHEAKLSCETLHGRLTDNVSIGLSTTSTDCTKYVWVNGSPMTWSKWAFGEPNRCSDRQCVKVRYGVFFTANCISAKRAAMCENVSEFSSSLSTLSTTTASEWTALTTLTYLTETSVSTRVNRPITSTLDVGTVMSTKVADATVPSLVTSAEPTMITTVAMETATPIITADLTNTRIVSSATTTTISTVAMEPLTPSISTNTPIAFTDLTNITIATKTDMATTLATPPRMSISCGCCSHKNITQITPTELGNAISKIRKELYVIKNTTTMFRRTKISVNDDRPISKVLGGVACIILVAVIGSIIISDITLMFVFLCK